jgi:2-polyprenyl-6-methoxyphenol hydroxylase-like FAD-dependent oxidoreductase
MPLNFGSPKEKPVVVVGAGLTGSMVTLLLARQRPDGFVVSFFIFHFVHAPKKKKKTQQCSTFTNLATITAKNLKAERDEVMFCLLFLELISSV